MDDNPCQFKHASSVVKNQNVLTTQLLELLKVDEGERHEEGRHEEDGYNRKTGKIVSKMKRNTGKIADKRTQMILLAIRYVEVVLHTLIPAIQVLFHQI